MSAGEVQVRAIGVDDWQLWRRLRLAALEEAPYAFSSKLADWQGEGDTESRWRRRLSDVPLNLIAEWQQTAAGMASAVAPNPDGAVELISMWVAPAARGRGVGDSLVTAVCEWAREQQGSKVILAVFGGNEHALAFYRRNGFIDTGATSSAAERQMARSLL
jgi:ribosomal protein S18 acetylase RimI-like enzyme